MTADLVKTIHDFSIAAREGRLEPAQAEQFEQLLIDNNEARQLYIDYVEASTLMPFALSRTEAPGQEQVVEAADAMQCEGSDLAGTSEKVSHVTRCLPSFLSRHDFSISVVVSAVGIVVLLAILAITPVSRHFSDHTEDLERDQKSADTEGIAALTGWHRVEWKEGCRISSRNCRLRAGQKVAIESGVAEITYDTGAKVVLEGPAVFVVGSQASGDQPLEPLQEDSRGQQLTNDANSGYLVLGKLVARVEGKKAQGFTVETPSGRVEDHGTEFGVEVDDRGAAEVVVLSGEVDVVREASGDGQELRVRLTKDEGAHIAAKRGKITRRDKVDARMVVAMKKRLKTIGAASAAADAQAGLFRIDLSDKAGSVAGWNVFSTTVGPTAITDLPVGGDSDVTLAITTPDAISANTEGAPWTTTTIDGVRVPPQARDDYVWNRKNGSSILFEFANLDAGTYNVSVFEGRTSDNNGQFGKVWVGTLADEPGSENTGDFAGSSATLTGLTIGAGESLFYRHLEDNIGGTSGIILRCTAVASEPSPAARDKERGRNRSKSETQ